MYYISHHMTLLFLLARYFLGNCYGFLIWLCNWPSKWCLPNDLLCSYSRNQVRANCQPVLQNICSKVGMYACNKIGSLEIFKFYNGVTVPVFPSWWKIFDEDSQMFFEQGTMTLQTCVVVGSLSAFPTDVQFVTFRHIA